VCSWKTLPGLSCGSNLAAGIRSLETTDGALGELPDSRLVKYPDQEPEDDQKHGDEAESRPSEYDQRLLTRSYKPDITSNAADAVWREIATVLAPNDPPPHQEAAPDQHACATKNGGNGGVGYAARMAVNAGSELLIFVQGVGLTNRH
jgi:hypothetical protein